MTRETWIAPNRRATFLALLFPTIFIWIGGMLLGIMTSSVWTFAGSVCLLLGLVLGGINVWQVNRPRLAYQDGNLLFYMRTGRPISLPLEELDSFFLGQGPAHIPDQGEYAPAAKNIVARLSRRQDIYHKRLVLKYLGKWEDGYVSICGTWCEPITEELILKLNQRLAERLEQAKPHDKK